MSKTAQCYLSCLQDPTSFDSNRYTKNVVKEILDSKLLKTLQLRVAFDDKIVSFRLL